MADSKRTEFIIKTPTNYSFQLPVREPPMRYHSSDFLKFMARGLIKSYAKDKDRLCDDSLVDIKDN